MTDTTFIPPAGASVWERKMLGFLREHVTRESALLEEYAFAAEYIESRALRYLMRILLDDEQRHHRWFHELASSLTMSASSSAGDPHVPDLDFRGFDQTAVQTLVQRMVDNEKDDARELKQLRRQLRDFEDTTLWALLVQLMELDTEKHLRILRFVQQHSKPRHWSRSIPRRGLPARVRPWRRTMPAGARGERAVGPHVESVP
jgi:rubrerythrin